MDFIYALLIMLGLRHPAPTQYHAPIKTLPLVVENDPQLAALGQWDWGPQ